MATTMESLQPELRATKTAPLNTDVDGLGNSKEQTGEVLSGRSGQPIQRYSQAGATTSI